MSDQINLESVTERFQDHLSIENNYRIILTGKFGTGKTFFLNSFFEDRKEYNKILISPVNYVVSSNEDIFEFIKADIIKDLFITKKISPTTLPADSDIQKVSEIIGSKSLVFGNFLLKTIAKLNPAAAAPQIIVDFLSKIYTGVSKLSTAPKKDIEMTRSEELADHWDALSEKLGSIYEHNYITKVINTFLSELRSNEKKKNVLIIDDLDRVDPEHIFRILNVLSAHNTQYDTENKFLFDHVIIVCDINNIKHTFHHKYGNLVDFEGYIDKFYSTDFFYFNNIDAIKTYVLGLASEQDSASAQILVLLFSHFVDQKILSLRQLIKHKYEYKHKNYILYEQTSIGKEINLGYYTGNTISSTIFCIQSKDFELLRVIKIMTMVFGNFHSFVQNLSGLVDIATLKSYQEYQKIWQFIALQYHIATVDGDKLFFSNPTRHNHDGDFPQVKIDNFTFNIKTQWSIRKPYESGNSFFDNSKAYLTESRSQNNTFAIGRIFYFLHQAIIEGSRKGYLIKAGITEIFY